MHYSKAMRKTTIAIGVLLIGIGLLLFGVVSAPAATVDDIGNLYSCDRRTDSLQADVRGDCAQSTTEKTGQSRAVYIYIGAALLLGSLGFLAVTSGTVRRVKASLIR